jgi:hypothetical protein
MNLFERLRRGLAHQDKGYEEAVPFSLEELLRPRHLLPPGSWFWSWIIRFHGRIERWWHELGLRLVAYAYARPRLSHSYGYVLKPPKFLEKEEKDKSE